MSDGKVFVRTCRKCGQMHQTADQSGKSPCDVCAAPSKAPTEAPPPVITQPELPSDDATTSVDHVLAPVVTDLDEDHTTD